MNTEIEIVENFRPRDNLVLVVKNHETGEVSVFSAHNGVPLSGRNEMRDLIGGTGIAPTHIAIGTGSTAFSDSDTILVAEEFRKEISGRFPDNSKVKFQLFVDTTEGNGFTYQEAILTNSSVKNTGDCFARALFTPQAKTSALSFTLSWTVTYT